jgi:hypothetical protein
MFLNEYQNSILAFLPVIEPDEYERHAERFASCCLEESAECLLAYRDAVRIGKDYDQLLEELGDLCFYLAATSSTYLSHQLPPIDSSYTLESMELIDLKDVESALYEILRRTAQISSYAKKHYGHGHTKESAKTITNIHFCLMIVMVIASKISEQLKTQSITLADIFKINLAKLSYRYPNGFNSESSQKRLDKTRNIVREYLPGMA